MAERITEDGRMKEETILQINHVDRVYEMAIPGFRLCPM